MTATMQLGPDAVLIGQAFREARVAAGLRQDEVGEQAAVSRFESGHRAPTLPTFMRWCAAAKLDPARILAAAKAKQRPKLCGYRVTLHSGEIEWFLACGAAILDGQLVLWTPDAGHERDATNFLHVAASLDLDAVAEWVEVSASDVPWETKAVRSLRGEEDEEDGTDG